MRDLSFVTETHRSQLTTQAPFIWLYELQVPGDPPTRYRLTNFTERVLFDQTTGGRDLVYYPAPIVQSPVEEGTDGSLPSITITVANTGPIMASIIDAADGFIGQPVSIMLVSSFELSNPDAAIRQDGEVISASISSESISFKVSAFNLFQLQFPPNVYRRRRCRWGFGSTECGYVANAAGAAFSSCGKTIGDCEERGNEEESRGLTKLHPARFGAFPGVPRPIT